jgi:IS5 family transposase
MIPPRIKPSAFFRRQPSSVDLFVEEHRQAKLGAYVANLAAMDALINFGAVAAAVDAACPLADRKKGRRPPCATEKIVFTPLGPDAELLVAHPEQRTPWDA